MNLAFQDLAADDFRYNLKFLEKKRNLIMEGDFMKVVYSDESMAVNALYFVCILKCKNRTGAERDGEKSRTEEPLLFGRKSIEELNDKCTVWFSPYDSENQKTVQDLIQYEQILIEEYVNQTMCRKMPVLLLKSQFLSGTLRLYKLQHAAHLVVKVSGIWESNDSFGITYKFIECHSL
jgi:hypothetical protein